MRIQHNIPAMNAYRNYNTNTKALQGNLQKLSSGYKINKAGDDAAGLAISEKMRAQITGLEVAQKNAKDGISLVQTAEGAMTEIHTMLNRMFSLAEQSANGTYSDEVDRVQLDNEFTKLKDEIDRIADATNFNGKKLLDGTSGTGGASSSSGNAQAVDAYEAILPAATDAANAVGFTKATFKFDGGTTEQQEALNKALAQKGIKINVQAAAANNSYTNATTIEFEGITDLGYTVKFKDASGAQSPITSTEKEKLGNGTTAGEVKNSGNIELSFYDETGTTKIGTLSLAQPTGNMAGAANAVSTTTLTFAKPVYGTNGTLGSKTNLTNFGIDDIDFGDVELKRGTEVKAEYTAAKALKITVGDKEFTFDATNDHSTVLAGSTIEAKDADGNVIKVKMNATPTNVKIGSDQTTAINDNANGNAPYSIGTVDIQKGKSGGGDGLRLRVGDSTETYDDIYVEIKSMKIDELTGMEGSATAKAGTVLADLKVTDPDEADKAMGALKDMINYVSNERGALGATQNRLDHTINNLSTMQENIQDAEATIRDVDVANEMMAYTKNNILVQSAQAMLAQANQLPQGVLQLLG